MVESQDAEDSALLRRFLARTGSKVDARNALYILLTAAEWMVRESGGQGCGEPWRRLLRAINAELAAADDDP